MVGKKVLKLIERQRLTHVWGRLLGILMLWVSFHSSWNFSYQYANQNCNNLCSPWLDFAQFWPALAVRSISAEIPFFAGYDFWPSWTKTRCLFFEVTTHKKPFSFFDLCITLAYRRWKNKKKKKRKMMMMRIKGEESTNGDVVYPKCSYIY